MNAITNVSPAVAPVSEVSPKIRRDGYGAIYPSDVPALVQALLERVLSEIGFEPGIESLNERGGFIANNCSVYGWDLSQGLVALQFRQAWKRKENHWLSSKKVYALAGLDEGDQLFCHAVASSFQRMRDIDNAYPIDVVRWAESKIFRIPVARLSTIIRQGDVALVPVRSIPAAAVPSDKAELVLRGSHRVVFGGVYRRDPETKRRFVDGMVRIDHIPGQHKAIDADGRFEIILGARREDLDFVDANTVD